MTWDSDEKELEAAIALHRRVVTGELNGMAALRAARPDGWTVEGWEHVARCRLPDDTKARARDALACEVAPLYQRAPGPPTT